MKDSFAGKVALITGGATGIGLGVAETLAAADASIALVGHEEEPLRSAGEVLSNKGYTVGAYVADVRVRDDVERAVSGCIKELGSVDILVNNAGVYPNKAAIELSEQDWDTVVDTNLKGTFLASQACARNMMDRGDGGRIVNISSTAARIARPGIAPYGASKAGISHLTRILAIEWGQVGITVNCVAPGIILTEQVQRQASTPEGRVEYESRLGRIPLGKFGSVEDVAEAVKWLASPAARYCTGTLLTIDGGYSLGVTTYK